MIVRSSLLLLLATTPAVAGQDLPECSQTKILAPTTMENDKLGFRVVMSATTDRVLSRRENLVVRRQEYLEIRGDG